MNPLLVVLGVYIAASLFTFIAYGLDKRAARLGNRRTPEARLHLCELLCGWPGALAGQAVFRHKRQKASYMLVFWGIVLLHVVAWAAYGAWRTGLVGGASD